MIAEETNPWEHRDAVLAAEYASHHEDARREIEINRSPEAVQFMVALQIIREDHQRTTGWVAEYQGEGEWVFTYSDPTQVDPGTGYKTGQPITITTKEKP